jgi:hypothetical protein
MQDMKKQVRIGILFLIAWIAMSVHIETSAKEKPQPWRYEIEPVAVGTKGSYLIKVWSYAKKEKAAVEQAKKNAVHGIIFRGFVGMNGVSSQKPLANNRPNLEEEKKDFFDAFFADGGKYMKFVNITGDGSINAKDRLKVGKEYKIGVVVSVNVDELRKDLEDAGIIRKLGAGFAP